MSEGYTQIKIEFLKWREHMNTSASTPRIAVIQRSTNEWTLHPLYDQTKRRIAALLGKGKTADEIIADNKNPDGTAKPGMSKANVYKCVKQLNKKEEKKDEVNRQDTNGNAEDVF